MKKLLKNRAFSSILFATIIFIFIYLLNGFFYGINERINSYFMNVKNNIQKSSGENIISDNIVVVTIDEKTLEELGTFPFSREHYKKIIENLNSSGSSVIGFDLIFADENKTSPELDKIFSQSIKESGNIVLGGALIAKKIENKTIGIIEKPIDIFYKNALSFGYFHPKLSENTGTVLSFAPNSQISDKNLVVGNYNHFSISLLQAYFSKIYNKDFINFSEKDRNYFYYRPGAGIPFSKTGSDEVLINYIPIPKGDTGKISNFSNISFLDVYKNNFNPRLFNGKIVIIGVTAKGIKDTFYTINGIEYGVFVLANIVNTVITKNFLVYFNENLEWILIFLLIVTSIYFSLSRSGYIIILSNISIAIIFLVIYPLFTIVFSSYILNHLFELFLALPFSIAFGNAIKYLLENNNKLKLSKALSEYVSKAIVNEILSNSGDIKLDGDNRKLTIFFSDIEGFTSISEKFSPQELVAFLRNYLSYMSNIILDNLGFINKYEGDAIMALWGAFSDSEKDSYNACYSAIKQQETLSELNKNWSVQGFPEIRARIGLHTGNAIVGNIGAIGRKIEYTALGDNVNLASRLEGVNKFYGTFICASESIYEETKDFFEYRYLDKITVKGKEKPIEIYELLSFKGELDDRRKRIREKFIIALEKYNSRYFKEAKTLFENIYDKFKDPPSYTYIKRCEYFLENKPEGVGDLVWSFDTK